MNLSVSILRLDGGTQPRESMDWGTVEEYAADMKGGEIFPPVDVFFDGIEYWLADGFHRVNAAQSVGESEIAVTIHNGTKDDAVWFSCGANRDPRGLRRTNADKRRSVICAFNSQKSKGLSDRAISDHCGVSHVTVKSVREELVSTVKNEQLRTGKDGKKRKTSSKKRSDAAKKRGKATAEPAAEDVPPGEAEEQATAQAARPTAAGPSYDNVAYAALALVDLALGLTVEQQDTIVRLVSARIGSNRKP